MKVKYKISVSSDAEETLKYPYVQIKIEIRNRSRTTIPLIKGIYHPDTCTGQALLEIRLIEMSGPHLAKDYNFINDSLCFVFCTGIHDIKATGK